MEVKAILFPTDFSEGSMRAFPYAVCMATTYRAKLYLLHVVYDISWTSALSVPYATVEPLYRRMEADAANALEELKVKQGEGLKDVEYIIIRGMPAEEILRFAREKRIDLIVIGGHGKTGIDKVLLGNTAQRVVRHAECPVLTIKGKRE